MTNLGSSPLQGLDKNPVPSPALGSLHCCHATYSCLFSQLLPNRSSMFTRMLR